MGEPISNTILGTAIGNLISSAAIAGLSAEFSALGSVFSASIQQASGYEDALASLDAVLTSTKNTAGGSKAQLLADAEAYEKTTKFSDEMAISAQKVLLTFTNIGATAFPGAMGAATDLSTVLGQDLQSSAVLVGNALDDPIRGIADLEKAGVSFTEEEKNAIKALVDSAKAGEAQDAVLQALETRFGGAARAAGGTFSGQLAILQNSFGDLLQELGGIFLPLLRDLVQWVNEKVMPAFKEWAQGNMPGIGKALQEIAHSVGKFVQAVVDYWPGVWKTIQDTWAKIQPLLGALVNLFQTVVLPAIQQFVQWVVANWPLVQQAIEQAWNVIQPILQALFDLWLVFMNALGQGLSEAWALLQPILEAIGQGLALMWEIMQPILQAVFAELGRFWTEIQPQLQAAWNAIVQAITQAWQFISDTIMPILDAIQQFILGVMTNIAGFIQAHYAEITTIVEGAMNYVMGFIQVVWSIIQGIIKIALDLISGDTTAATASWNEMLTGVMNGLTLMFQGAWTAITTTFALALQAIVDAITAKTIEISTAMGNAISGTVTAITGKVGEFYDAAVILVLGPKKDGEGGIVGGIKSKLEDVKTAIQNLISGAAGALSSLPKTILDQLGTIGTGIIDGLVQGIKDPLNKVQDALQGIIDAAIAAIKQKLGIASPSKVFAEIGAQMAVGLAQGFAAPPLAVSLVQNTLGTGLAAASTIYQQHYYNLTIHSNASTEQVVADFAMLRALAGS